MKAGRVRAIMRDSGHGASLDAGRIPDEFIRWRVSLGRETDSMRHERDMVRAVVSGKGFRPGFMFTDTELGAVPQPALLVYGTADPVGSVDLWRRVVGLLPRGELHLVENGGHLPWLDEPAGVATRVGRFLAAT
jgi:pimeloyl-ACP methyl ester carboxylesterase